MHGSGGASVSSIKVALPDPPSRDTGFFSGSYVKSGTELNGMPLWHQPKPDTVRDRWLYSTSAERGQRWCLTTSAAETPHDPPHDEMRAGRGSLQSRYTHIGVLPPWRVLTWEDATGDLTSSLRKQVDCRVSADGDADHPRGDPAGAAIPLGARSAPRTASAGDRVGEEEDRRVEVVRTLAKLGDWLRVRWRGRTGCVAAHHVAAGELRELTFLQARHGEGWRRKGTHSADVLLQPEAPDKRFWFYDSFKLSTHHIGDISKHQGGVVGAAEMAQTRAFRDIRKKLDYMIKKAHVECTSRFGVLFDIITTNSIIQTGIPHELGSTAYRYIERTHYDKVGMKFAFIGITDNVNSRAARDVFSRDHVAKDAMDRPVPEERKRSFRALDNQHMYCVFPMPDSPRLQEVEIRRIGDRTLLPGQLIPPKRTIPTVSALRQDRWDDLCEKGRAQASAIRYGDSAKASQLAAEIESLRSPLASPHGDEGTERSPRRTTLSRRPHTAGTAGAALRPTRPAATVLRRPLTADGPATSAGYQGAGVAAAAASPTAGVFITQPLTPGKPPASDVWDLAEQLLHDKEKAFSAGGVFSTCGRELPDPVALHARLKEAKAVNKHRSAHHGAGSPVGAAEQPHSNVVTVTAQAQVQKALTDALPHRFAAGSQVRVHDAARQALGRGAERIAQALGVSGVWRPGVAARSADTGVVVSSTAVAEGLGPVRAGATWYAVQLDRRRGDQREGDAVVLLADGAIEGGEGGKAAAIAFHAPYCAKSTSFLRRWSALASEFSSVTFLKVDVDRHTEVAAKCWVDCVPCFQIYHEGDLRFCTDETDEAALRAHLTEVSQAMQRRQRGEGYVSPKMQSVPGPSEGARRGSRAKA
eukprot:TRINITY_DN7056_c0_g1_i3.p1 TRINITY_DN7056_c0_g1~~TRINITY_DN7056_c0_g1_i3.p1  ORF type:complete len:965 (+),score=256.76 TRINITY_DN7056_c0_g1_i3:289-2895(+)